MANNGIITWSTTDANNATADTTINWAEGQSPSSVNNSARAMMGRLAELYNDICGTKITSTGAANTYAVTCAQGWDTYADGMRVAFIAHQTNTSAATLNADGIGDKPLRAIAGTALPPGAIVASQMYEAAYDAGGDEWLLVSAPLSWASQAQMEAASSTSVIVPPGRQHFHPSHPKCVAKFNAAGTLGHSYNASSVTDGGTGDFTVNYSTSFADTAYVAQLSILDTSATLIGSIRTIAAGSTRVFSYNTSSALADSNSYFFSAFGDHA